MRSVMMGLGLVTVAAGCRPTAEFTCQTNSDCGADVEGGVCEANGYCSFSDPTCDSNRRYGQYAPDHIANNCVDLQDAGGGSTSSDVSTPAGSSSPSLSTTTSGRPADDSPTGAVDSAASGPTTSADSGGSSDLGGSTSSSEQGDTSVSVETSDSEDSGAPEPCDGFVDDFEGGAIDPLWLRFPVTRIEQAQGELRFDVTAAVDGYPSAQIDQGFDLSHGRIRTRLADVVDVPLLQQILIIRDVDDVAGSTAATFVVEHNLLWARLQPSDAPIVNLAQVPFDPATHVWLQMRGEDGLIFFEVGNADLDFELLAEVASPFPLAGARPELVAGNWNMLEQNAQLSFDHFEICTNNP